ncbi:M48 family metallopeptidase [Vannielia litorea]|uniref:M48 family metallopeptidase n=1 Tax=Vannielia litorea TaxID=1217970 RepID=UPI001C97322B|nr:SprT family zinc-dependent metalloprotease [Vannielia litorea]MBY6048308.1 M48 family metallopeptidase [Vannielia litorea]MBY6075722.1 M48 family metallopeptidase [Vannielia litorea]
MGVITLPGEPEVEVTLRRSARARRLSLRVSGVDGRVTLTMPRFAPEREARSFAAEKAGWIRDRLAEQAPYTLAVVGAIVPVEGVPRQIERAPVRRITLAGQALQVPEEAARVPARLGAFLREMARERLSEASARHAGAIGRPFGKITLRDTRSRWGSCSHEGNLMYSWRLILAPPEVLDYVAAHEVAHLAHMDHSARFWAACGRLCPGYEAPRQWLRREGAALHRYGFKG